MAQTNGQKLHDFQARLAGSVPAEPSIPDTATQQLRRTLIQEEYAEVMAAFAALGSSGDDSAELSHLMHELADLLYVTYGTFWAFGVDPDPVFAEVHRANMSKAGGPRRADGKVLKPPDWQPADVAAVIERLRDD